MEGVALKITGSTEKVLDVLAGGRATPGFILRETELARNTIHTQLNTLLAADCVRYIDKPTGLYELVSDPRQASDRQPNVGTEHQQLHEQLEQAHERIEQLEATDDTDECHEAVLNVRSDLERAQSELESPTCDGGVVARHVDSALTTLNEVDV